MERAYLKPWEPIRIKWGRTTIKFLIGCKCTIDCIVHGRDGFIHERWKNDIVGTNFLLSVYK